MVIKFVSNIMSLVKTFIHTPHINHPFQINKRFPAMVRMGMVTEVTIGKLSVQIKETKN